MMFARNRKSDIFTRTPFHLSWKHFSLLNSLRPSPENALFHLLRPRWRPPDISIQSWWYRHRELLSSQNSNPPCRSRRVSVVVRAVGRNVITVSYNTKHSGIAIKSHGKAEIVKCARRLKLVSVVPSKTLCRIQTNDISVLQERKESARKFIYSPSIETYPLSSPPLASSCVALFFTRM